MLHNYILKKIIYLFTYLWPFVPQLHVVYAQWSNVWSFNYLVIELLCSYWTNEKAYIESICWAILVYGNHVLPRNCPLCTSSVRPLPHAVNFCRKTLHLCDRYPFRLLVKLVSAVSGRDIMVVKLLWTNVAKDWAKLEMVKQNLPSYFESS